MCYGGDMSEWKKYRRTGLSEMRPYAPGEDLSKVSVSSEDNPEIDLGMIARNPKNHADQWYVARAYMEENLEPAHDELTEHRAQFVYDAARLAAVAANAPIVPELWANREEPFKKQFREVIDRQCGPDRKNSPEELHDDWVKAYAEMGWIYGETRDPVKKTHPDMVPYWDLGQLERGKDAVFIALCEIARKWIYE